MTQTLPRAGAARALADKLIEFLETNRPPGGLFAPDVFLDMTAPTWRVQADNLEDAVTIRVDGHPTVGKVSRHRLDATSSGFVLEVEERWVDGGQSWYCREMLRADVGDDGLIHQLSVYCTGDWDEARVAAHAAEVQLLVP